MSPDVSVIIHRGANEIGGNTIQIRSGENSILLDYGIPLKEGLHAKIFHKTSQENIQALILSHPHLDHTGMSRVLKDIPFCIGYDTAKAMKIQFIHTKRGADLDQRNLIYFEPKKDFSIGNFQILPIPVNHSSYGAYSFIIKTKGKKIFYSGDLRAHGRSAYRWPDLLNSIKKESPIDLALMEGTNLNPARNYPSKTEQEIEKKLIEEFKKSYEPILIQFSPLNLDRFVSVIKACIRTKKTLIIDSYAAHFISEISKKENSDEKGTASIPPWDSPNFRIYPSYATKNIQDNGFKDKLIKNAIREGHNLQNSIILVRASMMNERIFQSFNLSGSRFIYSQYSGYRETQEMQKKFEQYLLEKGVVLTENDNIHTSGHIDRIHLKELLDIMHPKILCPIHSENREGMKELFSGQIRFSENGEENKI